ncbi:uncharacterized protein YjbI with pentapeptide repeats [Ancylobacter aquaticus]|uniref:Uncharacterized protein YjbI with pentapeptide repeats n=1 Tax=Ancylobacter aquaticus TaxID=100 RepID=A0A4R1I0D4_ANCAQ|nr:pentapeptide repeat-containing protein [Ancylobacter aquaticus]TCK28604.1 uncharacterized protein YjbI with pentapeptide repeats [Ancylobacter aquaticus]
MAGDFAGKFTFASSGMGAVVYLAPQLIRISGSKTIELPCMGLASPGATALATLYQSGASSDFLIQLANGRWLSFDASNELNWIVFADDRAQASPFRRTASGAGKESWGLFDGAQWRAVYYATNAAAPLLTLNPSETSGNIFAPTTITPSLADLRVAAARKADLAGVDFTGADLTGIDFTGADLSGAILDGTVAQRADFSGARMAGLRLGSAKADDAIFDGADMTGADLSGSAWGRPKSARNLVLVKAIVTGATLGSSSASLDMRGANFTGAELTKAMLDGLDLTGGTLADAIMTEASLQKAVLDGAALDRATITRCRLNKASLRGTRAHGTNFIGADLSGADLAKAAFGSRSYLFALATSFAGDLDHKAFPTPALIAAFQSSGATLDGSAPVFALMPGFKWRLDDERNGPFMLTLLAGRIEVFRETALPPACLSGILAFGTKASGAGLSGADLSFARWYGDGATLDHADLENAALSNGFFVGTDFTQAFLSGADFSNSVLCQAKMAGVLVTAGAGGGMTRFAGAAVAGVNFSQATLLSAQFYRAMVATGKGVPILILPGDQKPKLAAGDLSGAAPLFAAAGYPFGARASVSTVDFWQIDNAAVTDPTAPRAYRVETAATTFLVFDAKSGVFLFQLAKTSATDLKKPTASAALVAAFRGNGYALAGQAPIAGDAYFSILPASSSYGGPYGFSRIAVFEDDAGLSAHGTDLLLLRDWTILPQGAAFTGSIGFTDALGDSVIGPSGSRYALVRDGRMPEFQFLAARRAG